MNTNTSTSDKPNWKQIVVTAAVFAFTVAIVLYFLSVPIEQIVVAVPLSTVLYFVFNRVFAKMFTSPGPN